MKIIKYSSSKDIERIAKYMINIMAASRIFDDEGNFLNPESANGFPVFTVNDVEYNMKASLAYIYYTDNVSRKTFTVDNESEKIKEFTRLLTNTILSLESQYNLNKIPWYCDRYRTVFNSTETCIKVKPTLYSEEKADVDEKGEGNDKAKKKKNKTDKKNKNNNENKISKQFEIFIDRQYRNAKQESVPKFEWRLTSIVFDDELFDYNRVSEKILQKHVSSIFLDADDVVIFKDNEFVPLLQLGHFTAQTNTITAEPITISPYGNPLLFYLNIEWRNAYEQFRRIDFSNNKGSYIFRKLLTPVYEVEYNAGLFNEKNAEALSCTNCKSMLFEDIYVLLGRKIPMIEKDLNANGGDSDVNVGVNVGINAKENPKRKEKAKPTAKNAKTENPTNCIIDNNQKLILCPLCLHLSIYPFECEYQYTLRTKIPVSVHDIIELSVAPKPHKEALHILAGLYPNDFNVIKENDLNVLEIGEKNTNQGYIIANISIPRYSNRNDCSLVMKKSGYSGKKIIKTNIMN